MEENANNCDFSSSLLALPAILWLMLRPGLLRPVRLAGSQVNVSCLRIRTNRYRYTRHCSIAYYNNGRNETQTDWAAVTMRWEICASGPFTYQLQIVAIGQWRLGTLEQGNLHSTSPVPVLYKRANTCAHNSESREDYISNNHRKCEKV